MKYAPRLSFLADSTRQPYFLSTIIVCMCLKLPSTASDIVIFHKYETKLKGSFFTPAKEKNKTTKLFMQECNGSLFYCHGSLNIVYRQWDMHNSLAFDYRFD